MALLQSTPFLHDESFAQVVLDCACVGFGASVGIGAFGGIIAALVWRNRRAEAAQRVVPVAVQRDADALAAAERLLDAGDLDAAIAALGDVVVRSPAQAAVAHLRLGSAWRRKRDPERALGHLRRARDLGADLAALAVEVEAAERLPRR